MGWPGGIEIAPGGKPGGFCPGLGPVRTTKDVRLYLWLPWAWLRLQVPLDTNCPVFVSRYLVTFFFGTIWTQEYSPAPFVHEIIGHLVAFHAPSLTHECVELRRGGFGETFTTQPFAAP